MGLSRSLVVVFALMAFTGLALPVVLAVGLIPTAGFAAETDAERADHLLRQAVAMRRAGKYELALETNLEALRLIDTDTIDNEIKVARIQQTIAELYLRLNLVYEAAPFAGASHATFERLLPTLHIDFVRSLALLGRGQTLYGQLAEAEKTLLRARDLAEKIVGENDPETGVVLAYLGMLYEVKGELQLAERLLIKAHAALVSHGGSLDARVTNLDVEIALVRTIVAKGDYLRAYEDLVSIQERGVKTYGVVHPRTAEILQANGELYLKIGQREQARSNFWGAYQIRSETLGVLNLETTTSIRSLVATYDIRNRDEAANILHLLDNVEKVYAETGSGDSIEYATLLADRGYYQALKGDVPAATKTFEAAVQRARSPALARHPLSAGVLTSAALFHAWRGNWATAVALQEASERVRELNAGLVLATGSARQRYAYMTELRYPTDVTISLAAAAPAGTARAAESALATTLQRKARVLDVLRESASSPAEGRGRSAELKQERTRIQARLASLSVSRELLEARGPYIKEFDDLWIKLEEVESDLSETVGQDRDAAQPVTVREIQSAIPEGTLLVEFVRYQSIAFSAYSAPLGTRRPERYGAFLLARRLNASFLDLGEAANIDEQARAFLFALRDSGSQDVRKLSHVLYQSVMRPVLDAAGVARALVVSGDGVLDLVPVGALVDDEGRYLIERRLVSYLTSGRDLRRLGRQTPAKGSPLIVANPDYGPRRPTAAGTPEPEYRGQRSRDMRTTSFKPLPGTEVEGRELKRLIRNATLLHNKTAREGAIKAIHAPVLLHLATHGFSLAEPKRVDPGEVAFMRNSESSGTISVPWVEHGLLRSGLALAGANVLSDGENDGILTALEASGLDLAGTKLVVLSACDTGVGEQIAGEGVMGLRRAMIMAGAETLVMSLWKVSDSETATLMKSYYCNLGAGLGRAEALRDAQLKFLKDADTSHPFFWASFLSLGDWRPMTLSITESVCRR